MESALVLVALGGGEEMAGRGAKSMPHLHSADLGSRIDCRVQGQRGQGGAGVCEPPLTPAASALSGSQPRRQRHPGGPFSQHGPAGPHLS